MTENRITESPRLCGARRRVGKSGFDLASRIAPKG
jgi:hypothetical protein